jgi:hypothetical protein
MSEKVLFLVSVVVVLAFSGLVQAATPLDVNNFSFEYDINGAQIVGKTGIQPPYEQVLGWKGVGPWSGATIWCGSSLYDPCDPNTECNFVGATDGNVSAWINGAGCYIYQVTDNVFQVDKRYMITFDGQGWGYTVEPSLFYPLDGNFPDVNHIEVWSEEVFVDTDFPIGPDKYELDLEVIFTTVPGQACLGKKIGIKFLHDTGNGSYVFIDNVRLSEKPATQAGNPNPKHRATDVSILLTELSWAAGIEADEHDVYFGTSFDDVNNTNTSDTTGIYRAPRLSLGTTTYDPPENLAFSQSYYWRIDEVNDPCMWKGDVWRFTTADRITVDDFDSYVNETELYVAWDDYWTNQTGSTIFVETDANFTRDGNSLRYEYESTDKNGGTCVGAIASTDTTRLGISSDWTLSGAKALVVYFFGDAGNNATAADQLWLQLEDTSSNSGVVLYDDMNDVTIPEWHEWNIDLTIFDACGVSLGNIDKIHIGFGGETSGTGDCSQQSPGGTGTVWFDDIAVHPRRCVPSYSKGKGDFEDDCFIDTLDLKALSRDWLESGVWITASEPPTRPKLWFKFDEGAGSTTTANSGSLGSSRDGYLIDMFDPWRTPGAPAPDACDPNACLEFDGTNDYVNSPNMGIVTNELTISAWLKRSGSQFIFAGVLIVPGANDFNAMTGMQFGSTPNWNPTNTINYVWESMESTWGWDTELLVPESLWTFAAVVVEPTKATVWMHDGTEMSSAENIVDHGVVTFSRETRIGLNPKTNKKGDFVRFYEGEMDDVRLYDYALSQDEVLYLVDHGGSFYQSLEDWRADADKDDKVNFVDHAYMAENWLTEILWPEP